MKAIRLPGWRGIADGVLAGLLVVGLVGAGPPGTESLRPEDPLEPLLARLSQRAALYEKAALGFSCEETILIGRFDGKSGESRREQKTRYNYLYEGNPRSGYQEIRLLVEKNESPKESRLANPVLNAPGAYDWALLFTDRHRPHFRFEAAGEELVGFHPASVIVFAGAARFVRGREIGEWSGRVWVDRETGNFLKVSASPNNQEELLPLRMTEWLKSLRIGGVPVKRQPRGYRYQLSFTVEKFGLTFPGDAETRIFVLTPQGDEQIRERIAQRFRNYVFFNVRSEEDFLRAQPASDPKSSP